MTQNGRLQYGTVSKRGRETKCGSDVGVKKSRGLRARFVLCGKPVVLGALEEISSKRDAEREIWERLKLLNVGKEGSSGPMTLRRFAEELWKPSVFPSVKLSTRLFYDHNLETHILPVFGEVPLRSLTRTEYRSGCTVSSSPACPGTRSATFGPRLGPCSMPRRWTN
jgi:hypothetical protein